LPAILRCTLLSFALPFSLSLSLPFPSFSLSPSFLSLSLSPSLFLSPLSLFLIYILQFLPLFLIPLSTPSSLLPTPLLSIVFSIIIDVLLSTLFLSSFLVLFLPAPLPSPLPPVLPRGRRGLLLQSASQKSTEASALLLLFVIFPFLLSFSYRREGNVIGSKHKSSG
jgi:hypothetical protein